MKKNLTARTVVILVTILLCVYGIIGLPTSKASLQQNIHDNIRLGLDLLRPVAELHARPRLGRPGLAVPADLLHLEVELHRVAVGVQH